MIYIGNLLRNKKTYIVLFLVLVIIGCILFHQSIKIAETIIEYDVPFADSGSRWNNIKLMDVDVYGRRLYQYESIGNYTDVFSDYITYKTKNTPVLVYVICQKSGFNTMYCYENSYMYSSALIKKGDDKLENFKKENDWNKPLSEEKMIQYSIYDHSENLMDASFPEGITVVIEALENTLSKDIEDYYIDVIFTQDATAIYVLRELYQSVPEANKNVFGKSYVFIVSDESNVIYSELTSDIDEWRELINDFKASNNIK